uniref:helix-turn-helix domain-containing protein n=1 Tax=Paractinoplanes polyasparticus TaxID=2856853 RepID=UPI001C8426B7|nr:MerR family transcriptional regulator [Actinoplanes polyasparticus]
MPQIETYPIGDVARRTGLAVSAIRYYSDEGLVKTASVGQGRRRNYDLLAIAQLEFIGTLRELSTPMTEIRRLIAGVTNLRDVLIAHLTVVERRELELRGRRAALRALSRLDDPADLMHRFVGTPDAERERLADDLAADTGVPRPRLPDDPTAAQLEAWIELTRLARRREFRAAVRNLSVEANSGRESRREVIGKLLAAHHSGLPADSPHARRLAAGLAQEDTNVPPERPESDVAAYRRLISLLGAPPAGNRVSVEYDLTGFRDWLTVALTPRPLDRGTGSATRTAKI